MPSAREKCIYFTITREELKLFLTKYSNTQKNIIAKKIFVDYLHGKLQYKNESSDMDLKIKKELLKNMKIRNQILKIQKNDLS